MTELFCEISPIRQEIEEHFELGLDVKWMRATRTDLFLNYDDPNRET